MDARQLTDLLEGLDRGLLAGLGSGRVLRLVDDQQMAWGEGGEPDTLLDRLPVEAAGRKLDWLKQQAAQLLAAYYRSHPLTEAGFRRQARALLAGHGAVLFAAAPGECPRLSLFVDQGRVVVETPASPRHRYGAYCELPAGLPADWAADGVETWLDSGAAYAQYLSMNVCRYNC